MFEGEYSTIAGEVGIDGVAEFHQRQIVDARAFQRDAAGNPRRIDLDAGRGGDRGVAADDRRGRGRLAGWAWWRMAPSAVAAWSICGAVDPGVRLR